MDGVGLFAELCPIFTFFTLNFAHLARCAAAILARAAAESLRLPPPLDFPARPLNTAIALSNFARSAFPVEWSAFVNGAADFQADIRRDYFPYFTQGKNLTITSRRSLAPRASRCVITPLPVRTSMHSATP